MSNLAGGRVNQKLRTYNALVAAAAQLMREGKSFTVADVADFATVGRTTAYRYFPRVETLIAQASVHAIASAEQHNIDIALHHASSVEQRLQIAFENSDRSVNEHNYVYRTMLRLSLHGDNPQTGKQTRRSGVRKAVLDLAIGALRKQLGEKPYERLTSALTVFMGIEAAVALRDVCLLSENRAREVKLWGANALLQAALAEAPSRPKQRGASAAFGARPERTARRQSRRRKHAGKGA
jgi:AcrR family transcriptional regulator